jgi:hypothetical protein
MTDDALFAEMDLIADGLCAGSTLVDDLKIEFRQLQKCSFPELTTEEWHRLVRALACALPRAAPSEGGRGGCPRARALG